jgi:uncharacterized protein (DUF2384 family)
MNEQQTSTPAAHWRRRRARTNPMPRDEAVRQGDIARLAFQILGKDEAITFLNTDHALLGGRPIAIATGSRIGQLDVEAELGRMRDRQVDQL